MLKRHEIQVLRRAGHSQVEVAGLAGISEHTVRTVEAEPAVADIDDKAARCARRIGRPSKAEPFLPGDNYICALTTTTPEHPGERGVAS